MRIPDADITRLNADTDLVGLIQSRGVALKQQGRNWTGHCPFHDDTKHAIPPATLHRSTAAVAIPRPLGESTISIWRGPSQASSTPRPWQAGRSF